MENSDPSLPEALLAVEDNAVAIIARHTVDQERCTHKRDIDRCALEVDQSERTYKEAVAWLQCVFAL